MLGDTREVCEGDAAMSEHRKVTPGSPKWVICALLDNRGSRKLAEGEYLETLCIHARDTPVLGPAFQIHVSYLKSRITVTFSSCSKMNTLGQKDLIE